MVSQLYQVSIFLGTACLQCGCDICIKALGSAGGDIQDCLMVVPTDQHWVASRGEFKRYFSDLTSLQHAVTQLENMIQCPDKSLHLYIDRYKLHYAVTNK